MKKLLAVTFCLALVMPAQAEDLVFTMINNSSKNLLKFFTSPTDVNEWEEDVFGADVLQPGQEVEITIADDRTQCVYDMKMVFDDGQELFDKQDFCEIDSYTLYDK